MSGGMVIPGPTDTGIASRLRREREQILTNFRAEYFNQGDANDPLLNEKKRFTQQATRHIIKQSFDDGSIYEGEVGIDGKRHGKGNS